ncbi:MAG TPA: polysaccharide deacetylase family protein [Candidatus Luteococcus avicola]|nr:polysaccharide deacetylase family protein [Candidatus Luteococcus avicola]
MRCVRPVVFVLACGLLAACSGNPGPAASSSSSASVGSSVTTNWRVEQQVVNDKTFPVFLQWPVVPDASALTAALSDWIAQHRAVFERDYEPSEGSPPELNASWEAVLDHAGGIVGVREALLEFGGASGLTSSTTIYQDRASHAVWPSAELVADQNLAIDAVVKAMQAKGLEVDADALAEARADGHLLDDLSFTPDGSLIVRIGQGVLLAASEGQVDVVLDGATAGPLLSEAGRAVRDAATGRSIARSTLVATPSATAPPASPTTKINCAKLKCVALTFDDGPGQYTAHLLDTLEAHEVHATFFMLGQNALAYPELVRRAVAEGNQVGDHTFDHKQLTNLSASEQRYEVTRAADAIEQASGVRPTTLRPPYGAFNKATRQVAGMPLVLWDVDTRDWQTHSAAKTTKHALNDSTSGSIILMHDIHASTVEAIPGIITGLRKLGFTLVTVDELLGSPRSGQPYFRRNP